MFNCQYDLDRTPLKVGKMNYNKANAAPRKPLASQLLCCEMQLVPLKLLNNFLF